MVSEITGLHDGDNQRFADADRCQSKKNNGVDSTPENCMTDTQRWHTWYTSQTTQL